MKNVTILIPSYNEVRFIEKAVLSAVSQAEFVIVSDNNSTDGTKEVCRRLAKQYSNLRIIEQKKNIGSAKNSEGLFRLVETDYVISMGAHDILAENYVYELKKSLDENQDAVMAYAPAISISDDDKVLSEIMLDDFSQLFSSENELERIYAAITMKYNYVVFGLFRTNIFLKNTEFIKEAGIDHLIMAKCAQDGKFLRCLDTRFYLRVPTREESNDAYMERLAGAEEASSFDMSYMCINILKVIAECAGVAYQERIKYYGLAKENLQTRFARFCYKYINNKLKSLKDSNKKFILYGAGTDSISIIKSLDSAILYIIDKDEKKHDTSALNGLKIYSLSKLNEQKDVSIIISLVGRGDSIIYDLVNNYFVDRDRLISLDVDI